MTGSTLSRLAAHTETLSRRLAHGAAHRPHAVLVLWAVLTIVPLPGLLALHRNTDGHALVPPSDPAIAVDRDIRTRFDLRDQLILDVDTGRPDGIFDPALLADLRTLTDEVAALPGIGRAHVTSLATVVRDRLRPGAGATYGDFLRPLPTTARELRELDGDLALPSAAPYTGTIVAADRSAAAILIGAPEDVDRRGELLAAVEAIVEPYRKPGREISLVGAPAATALLADYILWDLAVLVPVSMLVICIVIWIGTRRIVPVAIAATKVGLCIVWTFGVLGWVGIPIYLTVTIVPVVLAAMCIADEIHLVTRYQEALREQMAPAAALARTIDEVATPVVIATTTTCIGFLACAGTGIAPVRALGIACAIGIGYSLGFSLVVTPALLAALPASMFRRSTAVGMHGQGRASVGAVSTWCLRHPYGAIGGLSVVSVVALVGAARAVVQDSWIDCFAKSSRFRTATERVNERMNGVHLLHAHLSFPRHPAHPFVRPEVLSATHAFEAFAATRATVGNVIGPAAQLRAVGAFWKLTGWTEDPAVAQRLMRRFDLAPGATRRRRVLNDAHDEAVVTLFLKHANYRDTARLIDDLRSYHDERLAPLGSRLQFAGDVAVSQAMIAAVVRSQMLSLPLALGGVFASVLVLCGSPALAAAALIPVAVSGLWVLGALGWMGIPLGVATSMFFAITVGLGVDSHSIHLIARYQRRRRDGDAMPVLAALRDVRVPILVNSFAVAGGFGLLVLSSVPANRHLGFLVAFTLVLGSALTLTGLAAWLVLGERVPERPKSAWTTTVAPIGTEPIVPGLGTRDVQEAKGATMRVFRIVLSLVMVLATSASSIAAPPSREGETTACQMQVQAMQARFKNQPPPTSLGFPAVPEIEFENSLITFRICKLKPNLTPEQEARRLASWKCCDPEFYDVELVKLDAYMRLCREAPVLNEIGFRELRFTIERWELFGKARIFGGDVVFSATPDVIQPKSLAFATKSGIPSKCRALQGGVSHSDECEEFKRPERITKLSKKDFPAMIVYNAVYDVWLNNKKLIAAEPGIAMARGIKQIPPSAITVAFQKPLETILPDPTPTHPEGTLIKICPGTCSGMVTIPEHVFWAGVDTAEGIKNGTIHLPDDWQPAAVTQPAPVP